ncbi:BTAD domain-containing putative transcriptional regulator [Actinomadura sp. NTSP31]|uniref:AfsR/SARP family transcriptional regulator n=1 Tax=Actinomadura sp. NTSP31 TaxID=1735447 RepID=UPI0035BF3D01
MLGPLEVVAHGRRLHSGGPRQQAVLSALLLEANRVVPVDRLVDAVWWGTPPPSATANVRGYVAGLRRVLRRTGRPSERLVTRAPGYLLRVEPGELDLHCFEELFARGEAALHGGTRHRAARDFEAALRLWRGQPLEAMRLGGALQAEVRRLEERRLLLMERYADTCLLLGRSDALLPDLRRLAARHPLHEGLWERLMLALYRVGRPADAIEAYALVRGRLADELGIDPGVRLRRLAQRILNADPGLDGAVQGEPGPREEPRPRGADVSCHLPMDIAEFTGRADELRRLGELADSARGGTAPTAVVIEGMAGVGKTRLAVRAAHQIARRGRFGEVRLFADLHAADPRHRPADPADVLETFLRLLGVPAAAVPDGTEGRAALFRARLHGRRALLVLDDAADEEQVRPLLPGDPSCLALLTSRRRLAGLDGVHRLDLGVLRPAEAAGLLRKVVGADRVDADPDAAARIAARCGGLPVALTLAARRLQTRPAWSPAGFAERLGDDRRALDELSLRDRSVSATFAPSYLALPEERRRVFRLLGLHPGSTFTAASAAALAGVPVADAEEALEFLLDEHLLEHAPEGRYRFHPLLRAYARQVAEAEEEPAERAAAVGRVVTWSVRAAERRPGADPRRLPIGAGTPGRAGRAGRPDPVA